MRCTASRSQPATGLLRHATGVHPKMLLASTSDHPKAQADVIYEDRLEVGGAVLHILDQPLQCLAALDPQPTLSGIGIGPQQFKTTARSIFSVGR
jgi:hypothetical protein